MWDLGNWDIVVLVSVISGCGLLCKIFGPLIAVTIVFVIIITACLTYIVTEDTPFTPHARLALEYLEKTLRRTIDASSELFRKFVGYITIIYEKIAALTPRDLWDGEKSQNLGYPTTPDRAGPGKTFSTTNLIDGLSPIPRDHFRSGDDLQNTFFSAMNSELPGRPLGQMTSSPLRPWCKEDSRNGDIFRSDASAYKNPWRNSPSQSPRLRRGENTSCGTPDSPWGTSISPKMRPRAAGVKTVQTVAGPLLASTRYNIDPKVYSDVTSPGLTTRLTKYATEANAKLTHQSQYGTGQFPRVNLNTSGIPLINARTGRTRNSVTVRISQPESTARYSPPERQVLLSEMFHGETKVGTTATLTTMTTGSSTTSTTTTTSTSSTVTPSVEQVLREISLKRHASREDVAFELAKKQRTEGLYGSERLENFEEITQKRGRDDSSRSGDEEASQPPNKSLRPTKRTKMPSCHDILSSLSSSIVDVPSGVKRKAIDSPRGGTPEMGKHFKSLESSGTGEFLAGRSVSEPELPRSRRLPVAEIVSTGGGQSTLVKHSVSESPRAIPKSPGIDGRRDITDNTRILVNKNDARSIGGVKKINKEIPVRLTDKLFMKAEPQNIDKLRNLIEEHESTKPKFKITDGHEIKKEDIVIMRQTSMKNRLRSMFDAISGKGSHAINPEVVIQAGDKGSLSQVPTAATLSSTTSTTNINSAPISTSALVPIIGKAKPSMTPGKHVTFQLRQSEDSLAAKESTLEEKNTTEPSTNVAKTPEMKIVRDSKAGGTSAVNFSPTILTTTVALPASLANSVTSTSQLSSSLFSSGTSSPVSGFAGSFGEKNNSSAGGFSFGAPKNSNAGKIDEGNLKNIPPSTQTSVAPVVPSSTSGGHFAFPSTTKASNGSEASSDPLASLGASLFTAHSQSPNNKKTFSFGSSTVTPAAMGQGKTSENTPEMSVPSGTKTAASGFNFSATSSSAAQTTTSSTGLFSTSTSATPVFSFGSGPTTTISAATSTSTSAAPGAKPDFSFPTARSTSECTTVTPVLSFGGTASNLFGVPASSSAPASEKPNIFGQSTTNTATTSATATSTPNIFGVTSPVTSQSQTANIFGVPSSTTTSSSAAPTESTNIFGSAATTLSSQPVSQTNIFGSVAAGNAATNPTTANIFGTSSSITTSSSAAPTESTKIHSSAPTNTSSAPAPQTNLFGSVAAGNAATNPTTASSFGFPSSITTSSSAAPTESTNIFGSAPTTSSSAPAPPTNLFGSVAACNATTNPTTASVFGGPGAPAFTSTSTFGGPNSATTSFTSPNPATTTSSFMSSSALVNLFNAAVTPATTTAPPSFVSVGFAQNVTAPPPAFGFTSSSTFASGGATAASPFETKSNETLGANNSIFGSSSVSTPSFNAPTSTASVFGAPAAPIATFGAANTSVPSFSAATTAPPAFGASNSTFSSVPTTAPPAFGATSGTTAFGAQNAAPTAGAPAFGTPITALTTRFGQNSSASFSAPGNNRPPPPFNAPNSTFSGFGTQSTTGTNSFGAPQPQPSTFGAGDNNNSSANTGFAFTASQNLPQQQQQQSQTGSVFTFGGGPPSGGVNNPPQGSFQFNASAPQTGGFNFSGAPSAPSLSFTKDTGASNSFNLPAPGAPPSFNAPPTGGMFSIGTGTTTPRSRQSRRRQR